MITKHILRGGIVMGLKITRDANLDKLFDKFAIGPDDQKRGKDERTPKKKPTADKKDDAK